MRRNKIKQFDVEKLRKHQKQRKKVFILIAGFLILITYLSFNPTFSLLPILAWIGLITSILIFTFSTDEINRQNKAKRRTIALIRQNYTPDIFELAKKIEYPYSLLKQIIDYLENTNQKK